MRIWHYSPNRAVNEGPTRLAESLGYTAQLRGPKEAEDAS